MNTKKFSDAMSELDTKYIDEALNYKKKVKKPVWVKWGAVAACLCLVIIGSFLVPHIVENDHDNPNVNPVAYPYVMVNDVIYLIDPEGYATSELPNEYVEIGKNRGQCVSRQGSKLVFTGLQSRRIYISKSRYNRRNICIHNTIFREW